MKHGVAMSKDLGDDWSAEAHLPAEAAEPWTEIWVCVDCYLAHSYPNEHAGIEQERGFLMGLARGTRPMPWALYPSDMKVGQITDNTAFPELDRDPDERAIRDYSTSRCDGCGTTLAGARWRMADWGDGS
jgi:hypothetical protein